jgi:5-methylcytosine-specific restriction enzyme subunit McrC
MNPINLFEYQNREDYKDSDSDLETFLDEIWQKREKSEYWSDEESNRTEVQRFLQFFHKTDEIKSNKYVGVIHFGRQVINLLPKIFYDPEKKYSHRDIEVIHCHIMWWLSYCNKIKFPNYNTSIGSLKGDLFEILIYQFAKYTRELINSSIYQQYQEEERELNFVKGRINTTAYINENIVKGRWHRINCTYELFSIDNKFNRIIKHVASFLYNESKNDENRKLLRDILFILDEVTLERSTAEECKLIQFNPMFSDFEIVRDYCYLFMKNSISYSYKNALNLFAFLIPMEYLFEDFIAGFIKKEIQGVGVKSQCATENLDEGGKFPICPDLIIETSTKKIIADAKYKVIYSDEYDAKRGVSQADLYQMVSYAIRFDIGEVMLFYPDTIKKYQNGHFIITVKDKFAKEKEIVIKAFQLPVIARELFEISNSFGINLQELFEDTRLKLVTELSSICDKPEGLLKKSNDINIHRCSVL